LSSESLAPIKLGYKRLLKSNNLHSTPIRGGRRCLMCNSLGKMSYMEYDDKTGLLICPDPDCKDVVFPPYEPYKGLNG